MNGSPKTSEMRLRMGLQGPKRILRNVSKMSRKSKNHQRKAVAPVLATLLMIAVAVAMSVIIFVWSQGFLSQTSQSTGSQQGAQNQAAQSSINVESLTFQSTATTDAAINIIVRNVGAVAINIGQVSVTGISSNAGFKGSIIALVNTTGGIDPTPTVSSGTWNVTGTDASLKTIAKGAAATIKLGMDTVTSSNDTYLRPGDVVTVKVTTDAGTFAQQTYTVP